MSDELTLNDLPYRGISFNAYQEQATTTAQYPGQGSFIGLAYATLGLNGEAGETGEQVKKIWRDDAADIQQKCLEAVDEAGRGLKSAVLSYDIVIERLARRIKEAFEVPVTEERHEKILKELGDTLWYAAQVATELGVDLGEVAQQNLDKLARRRAAGLISGEGSDR